MHDLSLPDLNDLRLFVHVVEEGGFAAAGRKLGQPRSYVSRRINQLEERLGIRLLQRSTRSFQVTDVGLEFYQHCLAMRTEAEAAINVIDRLRAEPVGTLRIACPASMIQYQVNEFIARFLQKYPKVTLNLESTNRRVDVLREGFDLAIRVRFPPLEDSGDVIRQFGSDHQYLVSTPDCARLHPAFPLKSPAQLQDLPSLSWNPDETNPVWTLEGPDNQIMRIPHHPRLRTQDMSALLSATLSGIGICQLPGAVAADYLRTGQLIEVLPGWRPKSGLIHAVFASRRGRIPAVLALLDHLEAEYKAVGDRLEKLLQY